jgi:thrombospondin motif-containing protein 9
VTTVHVSLYGASGSGRNYGQYHVHELPVDPSNPNGACSAQAVGGHFNPYNVPVGMCNLDDPSTCEVGDLSGKHGVFPASTVEMLYIDTNLPLSGPFSIVGKALVVHDAAGAQWFCADVVGNVCPPEGAPDPVPLPNTPVPSYTGVPSRPGTPVPAQSLQRITQLPTPLGPNILGGAEFYNYGFSGWSSCSVSCGTGVRSRSVFCISGATSEKTAEANCASVPFKAPSSEACSDSACSGSGPADSGDLLDQIMTRIPEVMDCTAGCRDQPAPKGCADLERYLSASGCASTCGEAAASILRDAINCVATGPPLSAVQTTTTAAPASNKSPNGAEAQIVGFFNYGASPWGQCSVSCGKGDRIRAVFCVSTSGRTSEENCANVPKMPSSEACSASACGDDTQQTTQPAPTSAGSTASTTSAGTTTSPNVANPTVWTASAVSAVWVAEGWSSCSATCGGGSQQRKVYCSDGRGPTSNEAACLSAKPTSEQICNTAACLSYEWNANSWGTCSVTCGTGTQSRIVKCQVQGTGTEVAKSNCNNLTPLLDSIKCNPGTCQRFMYQPSEWGACSVTCGFGLRSRSVSCTADGVVVSDISTCASLGPAPDTKTVCSNPLCTTYDWGFGNWSSCSSSCGGGGEQTRSITCMGSNGLPAISDDPCVAAKKPAARQQCGNAPCVEYSYGFNNWGSCSVTCGSGTRVRDVYCVSSLTGQVSEVYCSKLPQRPTPSVDCFEGQCIDYAWGTSAWGPCSVTCGTGLMARDVFCMGTDGVRHNESSCFAIRSGKDAGTKVMSFVLHGLRVSQRPSAGF